VTDHDQLRRILQALHTKAATRSLSIDRHSMAKPAIRARSKNEYPRLADEIDEPLPAFEDVDGFVQACDESLPWSIHVLPVVM